MLRGPFFRINDSEHHFQLVSVWRGEKETLNYWSYCFLVKRSTAMPFTLRISPFFLKKICSSTLPTSFINGKQCDVGCFRFAMKTTLKAREPKIFISSPKHGKKFLILEVERVRFILRDGILSIFWNFVLRRESGYLRRISFFV